MNVSAPAGYASFTANGTVVVARNDAADGVKRALRDVRTLHCWASTLPGAKPFQGRATAWGARLPGSSLDVVVRHARHGGFFASLTGDRFWWPSRAPWELTVSERLREAGVPTPALIAYALYPAGFGMCRCDVATKRLPDGADFPELWLTADAASRASMLESTAALVRAMSAVGAHHPDLNAKNVYLARDGNAWRAYVLDVDRIVFRDVAARQMVTELNLARLVRSLRKFRVKHRLPVRDEEIATFERIVRGS